MVTVSADVADKFHFIVLTLWNSIMKFCKSTHDLVTQWGCPDKLWQKPWSCGVRQMPELADCFTTADIKLIQRFCFDTPCLATIQMATFSNKYPWTNLTTGQLEITHNAIRPRNKVTFLKTYFFRHHTDRLLWCYLVVCSSVPMSRSLILDRGHVLCHWK